MNWKDYPDNWKNKKRDKSEKKQEMNEMKRDVSSDSSSNEDSDCTEESNCMGDTKSEKKTVGGEVLISIVRETGRKNYVCLLDSGTSSSLMSDKLVGKNAKVTSNRTVKWETKAGEFKTKKEVLVKDCKLPQFTTNRKFEGKFNLFKKHKNDRYHAILGRDLLEKIGLDLLYSTGEIRWGDISVKMVPLGHFSDCKSRRRMFEGVTRLVIDGQETYVQQILESRYEAADLNEVVEAQTSIDGIRKGKFKSMLKRIKELFLGRKGKWKGEKVSIELKENAKPVQSKPYKVPHAHLKVFKEEIERLVKIGLFTRVQLSEWSSPTFCIPKKDGRIRIVSDYRKVNKLIKRKAKNLPNIMDTLMSLVSFQYVTCIDLNMGYYAMELNEQAKKICTIVLPWGFYQYNMLPMGVVVATDIFQARLGDLLGDLPHVVVFLDDILIVSAGSFDDHLEQVEAVLQRLLNA